MSDIICECKGKMYWNGFASMGGWHSNYYKCIKCGYETTIYDEELNNNKNYYVKKKVEK